jgi:hypothetical protein
MKRTSTTLSRKKPRRNRRLKRRAISVAIQDMLTWAEKNERRRRELPLMSINPNTPYPSAN